MTPLSAFYQMNLPVNTMMCPNERIVVHYFDIYITVTKQISVFGTVQVFFGPRHW